MLVAEVDRNRPRILVAAIVSEVNRLVADPQLSGTGIADRDNQARRIPGNLDAGLFVGVQGPVQQGIVVSLHLHPSPVRRVNPQGRISAQPVGCVGHTGIVAVGLLKLNGVFSRLLDNLLAG